MERNEISELIEKSLIILDKPSGPTSHKTTEYVKKILQVNKAGHSGTLDPKVTGVLPIALNKATRILEFLLTLPKEYVGVMRLHSEVSLSEIKKLIRKKFLGRIKQIPPKKSAVKRVLREREVYSFKLSEKQGKDILFQIKCQAGTYIRKNIHDLGQELGKERGKELGGAHMLELRRIAVGNLKEKNSFTLYALTEAYEEAKKGKHQKLKKMLLPIEKAVSHLPKLHLKKEALEKIKFGQYISENELSKEAKIKEFEENKIFAGFFNKKLVCILKSEKQNLKPEKVFV